MDRREFTRNVGVVAAGAWAAPTIFSTRPVAAAVGSTGDSCEIPDVSNGAVWLADPPASLAEGGPFDSNNETYVFKEQGGVTLAAPLVVNRISGGVFDGGDNQDETIPAGTTICSYYVHGDRLDDNGRLQGQMVFQNSEILGLIYRNAALNASSFLEAPGTTYVTGQMEGNDRMEMVLSPGMHFLRWDMRFGPHLDQIRVIVACP